MSNQLRDFKRALLFAVIIFAGLAAKASNDILIIDVNNVVPEIDYIQGFLKAERAQGRELDTKVVLVPSETRLPMETRRRIQDMYLKLIDPNAKYYQDNCSMSAMAANPRLKENCDRALAIANPARKEANRLLNGSRMDGGFVVEDIMTELKAALSGPYQFSRVIISGHHGSDVTRGILAGELYAGFTSDIAQEMLNSSPSTRNVRSLIMLGCWTGREDMMRNAWGKVLPEAPFHLGFVEQAPAKVNPTNLMILDSILRNEQVIGASETEADLRQNYSKLKIADRRVAVKVKDMYISPSGLKRLQ